MSDLQPSKGYTYTADKGNRIGIPHHNNLANNMDAAYLAKGREVVVGGIADGCGGDGEHSEVSALFFIEWLCDRLLSLLEGKDGLKDIHIEKAVNQLWSEYIDNIEQMISLRFKGIDHPETQDEKTFSTRFMLHTAVIYITIYDHIQDCWNAYIIYRGDGYIAVDNRILNLETLDAIKHKGVLYPALALDIYNGDFSSQVQSMASQPFNIITVGQSGKQWKRIAVASDGLRFLTSNMLNDVVFPPYKVPSPSLRKPGPTAITQAINSRISDQTIDLDDDLAIVNFIT